MEWPYLLMQQSMHVRVLELHGHCKSVSSNEHGELTAAAGHR